MDFNTYQAKTGETAVYPGQGTVDGLIYVALGLGEAGELQGKVKKILRDDNKVLTAAKQTAIIDELGDVLWYVARMAEELGTTLENVAYRNITKLRDRADRGTLKGEGDNR